MIQTDLSQRLAALIRKEGLRPGDRLPAERLLAARLHASRASLREVLHSMAQSGMILSRPGSGHYLQTPPLTLADPPMALLIRQNPSYWQDIMEIRRTLEAEAAYHAALRATEADRARLTAHASSMACTHATKDPQADAKADAGLHLLIAEASHNLVLLHIMRGLFELLASSISHSLEKLYTRPKTFQALMRQHQALLSAIIAGQPDQARKAALLHLDFVASTLRQIEDDEARQLRLLPSNHISMSQTP